MRQLGELNKNGAKEFEEMGVEVVAVFREEREGLAGLKKIKAKTKVPFTLALDTPAKATKAYSNGRKEFDNYVVDKNGVIRGIIDGSLKSRAKSDKLIEIVKSVESKSGGASDMAAAAPADDKAAVEQTVMDYADGIYKADEDLMKQAVHPDLKMSATADTAKAGVVEISFAQLLKVAEGYKAKGVFPADAPKKVQVFDVTGKVASAKLSTAWGTDMVHLVKEDDKWKILQIVLLSSRAKPQ